MNRPIKLVLAAALSASPAIVAAQHDMSHMNPGALQAPLGVPLERVISGTAWLPDSSPMHMLHVSAGSWSLMAHGAAFPMYNRQMNLHGDTRPDLLDYEMLMASRNAAGGLLHITAMTSFGALSMPDTGFAELLQTGETFRGRRIANTQHPHDLIGELSAMYDHSVTSKLATTFYAAVVGDPALGPVSYMHRPSAAIDPFPPLGHHGQDGTHGAAGVVTAGLYSTRVKVEASAFNGREPDENRNNLDYRGQALDSYSGRVTMLPTGRIALSAWAGYIPHHDPLDTTVSLQRYGASILTEGRGISGGAWSTAVIWGLDNHHHSARLHVHDATSPAPAHHPMTSAMLESTLGIGARSSVYLRAEQLQKMADDLGFLGGDLGQMFTLREVTVGAERDLVARHGLAAGVGARGTMNFLPETLRLTYQGTRPTGFAVYARIAII